MKRFKCLKRSARDRRAQSEKIGPKCKGSTVGFKAYPTADKYEYICIRIRLLDHALSRHYRILCTVHRTSNARLLTISSNSRTNTLPSSFISCYSLLWQHHSRSRCDVVTSILSRKVSGNSDFTIAMNNATTFSSLRSRYIFYYEKTLNVILF